MFNIPPSRPHHNPVQPHWDSQAALLTDLAVHDLEVGGEVLPTFVAFLDDQALFLATLRPFPAGGYQRPLIEVGAVAIGLGANRAMVSLSGRAWSTRDPIAPVSDHGDLRQRVITLHSADASLTPTVVLNRIVPYELVPTGPAHEVVVDCGSPDCPEEHRLATHGVVETGATMCEASGVGWIPEALGAMVTTPDAGQGDDGDPVALAHQIKRCESLGHRFAWAGDVAPYIDQVCS